MGDKPTVIRDEFSALRGQLIALAEIVENAFAECLLALMDSDAGAARETREEDYKAHRAWMQADTVCVDLLANGGLDLREVRTVCAAIKMALNLKLMADDSVRVTQSMHDCPPDSFPHGPATDALAQMAEVVQSMVSDVVEALVNHTPERAAGLAHLYRELDQVFAVVSDGAAAAVRENEATPETGIGMALVGRALRGVARNAVELATQIAHLYEADEDEGPERIVPASAAGDESALDWAAAADDGNEEDDWEEPPTTFEFGDETNRDDDEEEDEDFVDVYADPDRDEEDEDDEDLY